MARRQAFRAARRAAGHTQESLAELLHVDVSTVKGWERGTEPAAFRVPLLAKALDISVGRLQEILSETEPPRSDGREAGSGQPGAAQSRGGAMPARPGQAAAPGARDGAPDQAQDVGLKYERSVPATVEVVAKLGRYDMERRHFLVGGLFAVAASVAPSRDWLVATLDEATSARGKVSTAQVDAIRRTFGIFQELDVMRGGGHARNQLAQYLDSHVVPLLRANSPETESGRTLYEAASEQLYLLGWMAFDNGEHVVAQRYLIQSLRLAESSKNIELGAHVLAGLSDQATLTGHPDHGVPLARTGIAGLERGHSPACLADLRALQARAHAAMGDADAAARAIGLSQEAFAAVVPESEPEWARFIDVAYLNGEYAHSFRDLDEPVEAAKYAILSADAAAAQKRARRGSLANAAMARAALSDHDLAKAASAALTATQLASTVKSSRSTGAVADLRTRLQGHRQSPHVREFFEQSDALIPVLA
jgi:transcriptional regulator with XRE-family HTH domain